MDDVRGRHGHDEHVPARGGQNLELAPVDRGSERGAALLNQGSCRSNSDGLFDIAHVEGHVQHEGVRYADR